MSTLSAQVLRLLDRLNTWTVQQVFTAIRTKPTISETTLLQAYDVDGTAYKTFATLTAGNTPDLTIAPPTGGTVTVQASTFKSSDGSPGVSGTATGASTLTIKDGLIVTIVP
jgi:hypothetical protein